MTRILRKDIGQLFCAPLRWNEYGSEEEIRAFLDWAVELNLGGLILFGGEIETTPRLMTYLQGCTDIPFLIMADVETGTAQQIPGGTAFPGMMALGATRSAELTSRVAGAIARESIALGINVVLAPVLDVCTNPLNPIVGTRSFGDDPEVVSELGAAYVKGCQERGAMATAKHFPGHGDTDADSHIELPIIRRGPGSLKEIEMGPFERAIQSGVSAVMVGHIALPAVTGSESVPASLSRKIVTELLRDRLGYDDLVMTDAMIMEGARRGDREEDPIVSALKAGIDMLLYVEDESRGVEVVRTALDENRIDPDIVEQAIRRISNARERLIRINPDDADGVRIVGCREHLDLASRVADASATLVRNRGNILPVSPGESAVFVILEDDEKKGERVLTERLRAIYPENQLIHLESDVRPPGEREFDQIEAASKVIVFVFTAVRAWRGIADLSSSGRSIVDRILDRSDRTAIVSLGSPHVMRYFPRIDGFLTLYSGSCPSQESAVRVVNGTLNPPGRLPVSIPGLYPTGWGLSFERSVE